MNSDERIIRIYIKGREFPIMLSGTKVEGIGYSFEKEGQFKDCLKAYAGKKTLIVPLDKLDAVETEL